MGRVQQKDMPIASSRVGATITFLASSAVATASVLTEPGPKISIVTRPQVGEGVLWTEGVVSLVHSQPVDSTRCRPDVLLVEGLARHILDIHCRSRKLRRFRIP